MNTAQQVVDLSVNLSASLRCSADWRIIAVGFGGTMRSESFCDFPDGSIIYFMAGSGLPVESFKSMKGNV